MSKMDKNLILPLAAQSRLDVKSVRSKKKSLLINLSKSITYYRATYLLQMTFRKDDLLQIERFFKHSLHYHQHDITLQQVGQHAKTGALAKKKLKKFIIWKIIPKGFR
jgi:hypothetical protein